MSRTEPTFITESIYWKYRDKQDADFKSAFTEQASLIEKGHEQLHNRIDNGLKQLHGTFNNKLSTVDGTLSGRLSELKNELDEVKIDLREVKVDLKNLKAEVHEVKAEVHEVKAEVHEVKAEVHEVKAEVHEVKAEVKAEIQQVKTEIQEVKAELHGRLDQMDRRLTQLEAEFSQMAGRRINKSKRLAYDGIEIIGINRQPTGLEMPIYFPKTVNDFWKLKNAINKEKLIYLIRFYDIKNFEYWGQTYYNFEDDALQLDFSLENAIERYPEIALEKLAEILNLPFDEICDFFRRAAEYEQTQQSSAIKRHKAGPNEVVKRSKTSSQLSLGRLIGAAPEPGPTSSTSLASARISWDVTERGARVAELEEKMKAAPSSSPESLKDSLTNVTSSQESRHLGDSKKPRSNKS